VSTFRGELHFPDLQLNAHYGGDRLECVVGYGESGISLRGLPLLHLPYPTLKSELHTRGFRDQLIDDLHVYLDLGLAFDVEEDRVVSVTVFPKGYF
jgi:hypothetical protein